MVRVFGWWRAGGRDWVKAHLGDRGLALARYHLAPVALWLLMPQHLYWFIWFSSPANGGENPNASGWSSSFAFYRAGVSGDYHVGPAFALIVFALGSLALAACARRAAVTRGMLAIGIFTLLSAILLLEHPNQKYRFLHTWLPVVWVAAGIGFAWLVEIIGKLRVPTLAPLAAIMALLALGAFQQEGIANPGHASERGLHDLTGSWRDVTDAYLPELANSKRVGVFSNMPIKFVAGWSFIERYRRAECLEIDLREVGNYSPATREGFERWIGKTSCDTVVYIDVKSDSPYAEPFPAESNEVVGAMLPRQSVFKMARRIELPSYGCMVTVWKREPIADATPAGSPGR